MNRALLFYGKSLAIMFLLVLPIMGVGISVAASALGDVGADGGFGARVRDQFGTLYLLAWPVMALLVLAHSAWVHLLNARGSPPRGLARVLAGAAIAGLTGLALALGNGYTTGEATKLVVEYVILGALYGLLATKLGGLPNTALREPLSTARG